MYNYTVQLCITTVHTLYTDQMHTSCDTCTVHYTVYNGRLNNQPTTQTKATQTYNSTTVQGDWLQSPYTTNNTYTEYRVQTQQTDRQTDRYTGWDTYTHYTDK